MKIVGGLEKGVVVNAAAVIASTFSAPTETTAIATTEAAEHWKQQISDQQRQRLLQQHQQHQQGNDGHLRHEPSPIYVGRHFKLVFLSVLGVTVISGLLQVYIANSWPTPSPNQQATFESFGFAWKAGLGVVFGLMGGKLT
jgi:hypothetical protein